MGGYCYGDAEELSLAILEFFEANLTFTVQLSTLKIGSWNTTADGSPEVTGASLELGTGLFSAVEEAEKWPDPEIRRIRFYTKTGVAKRQIYFPDSHEVVIQPTKIVRLQYIYLADKMSDDKLLHHFSTSPKHEPTYFPHELRSVFKFMKTNTEYELFPADQPRRYKRINGEWVMYYGVLSNTIDRE